MRLKVTSGFPPGFEYRTVFLYSVFVVFCCTGAVVVTVGFEDVVVLVIVFCGVVTVLLFVVVFATGTGFVRVRNWRKDALVRLAPHTVPIFRVSIFFPTATPLIDDPKRLI